MPRTPKAITPPGTVRFLGSAKYSKVKAKSATVYEFRKGETVVIAYEDWEWFLDLFDAVHRFEIVTEPAIPEPETETVSTPDEPEVVESLVSVPVGMPIMSDLSESITFGENKEN